MKRFIITLALILVAMSAWADWAYIDSMTQSEFTNFLEEELRSGYTQLDVTRQDMATVNHFINKIIYPRTNACYVIWWVKDGWFYNLYVRIGETQTIVYKMGERKRTR